MKKLYYFVVAICTALTACDDSLLDVTPRDRLSDGNIWADESSADLFLNDIYDKLPDGNNYQDPFENFSDNSMNGFSWAPSRSLERESSYTPYAYPDGGITLNIYWDTNYSFIRKCNIFIKEVSKSNLSDNYKKERIAEARFLRAFFYHILWMNYGGVPLITEPLDRITQGDEIFVPRSTIEETADFLIDELRLAAVDLSITKEPGRVSKGAALALKGWVELYFASPLHNPDNDLRRWEQAAATNQEIMDLAVYHLYPNYGKLFLPEGNTNEEGIFYRQYYPGAKGGRESSYMSTPYTGNGGHTSWGAVNPTHNLVADYAMSNGKTIDEPDSGYDEQNPYLNREKRFYETIVYDGSYWYNTTIYTRLGMNSLNELDLSDASDATNTGYNLRKRMNPNIALGAANWDGATSSQNYYLFRYAEVLLNYAEARNESVGPDVSVYDAVNAVRERNPEESYLPKLKEGLSKDEMRKAIRRERRVELAFEDKRRFDLLRWKIAEEVYSQGLQAMRIEEVNGRLKYTVIQAPDGKRKFESKNYVFPVPRQVLDQNPKILEQNGGPDNWENGQNPGYDK